MDNLKITIKDVLVKTCDNIYIGRLFKEPLYDSEKYENILIQNIIYKYFEKIDNSLTKGHVFDNYPSYNPKIRKQDTVILDNLFFKDKICTGGKSSKDRFTLYFLDGSTFTIKYDEFDKIEINYDPNDFFAKDLGYDVLHAVVRGKNKKISSNLQSKIINTCEYIDTEIHDRSINNSISRERVKNTCIFYLSEEIDKAIDTVKGKIKDINDKVLPLIEIVSDNLATLEIKKNTLLEYESKLKEVVENSEAEIKDINDKVLPLSEYESELKGVEQAKIKGKIKIIEKDIKDIDKQIKDDEKVIDKQKLQLKKYENIYKKLHSDSVAIKSLIFKFELFIYKGLPITFDGLPSNYVFIYDNDKFSTDSNITLYTLNKLINLLESEDEERIKEFISILKNVFINTDEVLNDTKDNFKNIDTLKEIRSLCLEKIKSDDIIELSMDSIKKEIYDKSRLMQFSNSVSAVIDELQQNNIVEMDKYIY